MGQPGTNVLRETARYACQEGAFWTPSQFCDVVQMENSETITWQSAAAGNNAGLALKVQGGAATVCHFSSGPCSFEFRLNQVTLAPMVVNAGGVGRHVTVGPTLRENGPRKVKLTYWDTEQVGGVFPYWVRVV